MRIDDLLGESRWLIPWCVMCYALGWILGLL